MGEWSCRQTNPHIEAPGLIIAIYIVLSLPKYICARATATTSCIDTSMLKMLPCQAAAEQVTLQFHPLLPHSNFLALYTDYELARAQYWFLFLPFNALIAVLTPYTGLSYDGKLFRHHMPTLIVIIIIRVSFYARRCSSNTEKCLYVPYYVLYLHIMSRSVYSIGQPKIFLSYTGN